MVSHLPWNRQTFDIWISQSIDGYMDWSKSDVVFKKLDYDYLQFVLVPLLWLSKVDMTWDSHSRSHHYGFQCVMQKEKGPNYTKQIELVYPEFDRALD